MRNTVLQLSGILLILSSVVSAQVDPARPNWAGIWGIFGSEVFEKPWLKGSVLTVNWEEIEPAEGQFDFDPLLHKIETAVGNNQRYVVKVYVDNCPKWLFEKGVPGVEVDYSNRRDGERESWQPVYFPFYLDAIYRAHLQRMWDRVQVFIQCLPSPKRERFVGFQVPMGRSGDAEPYPGPAINTAYHIDPLGDEWTHYQIEMLDRFLERLQANGLLNGFVHPFVKLTKPAVMLAQEKKLSLNYKSVIVAQAYQLHNEMQQEYLHDIIFSMQPDGSDYVRCRGEFGEVVKNDSSWLAAAPKWHYYWQCLWMLTYGLDMFNFKPGTLAIEGDPFSDSFEFFNERAGYKEPRTARYAYVAFRDALDVTNLERFPENVFGKISNQLVRYKNIIESMAAFGARQDDIDSQSIKQTFQYLLKRKALNDAGINVWQQNFEVYLNQIEPNEHDQGYWRVGSVDQPYGRYARGFDVQNGKNEIYLDVDDRMFDESSATLRKTVAIRVVYFDEGTGNWALYYDSTRSEDPVPAMVVSKTNTGLWKEISITIDDACFGNRGPHGADLFLKNEDGEDDLFHMVDIHFTERES